MEKEELEELMAKYGVKGEEALREKLTENIDLQITEINCTTEIINKQIIRENRAYCRLFGFTVMAAGVLGISLVVYMIATFLSECGYISGEFAFNLSLVILIVGLIIAIIGALIGEPNSEFPTKPLPAFEERKQGANDNE